ISNSFSPTFFPTQTRRDPIPLPSKTPLNTHPSPLKFSKTNQSSKLDNGQVLNSNNANLLLLLSLVLPSQSETIHDLLPTYGLPPGLLPSTAFKSYSLTTDNEFFIELASSCYVHFSSDLVYYGNKITGKLSYGRLTDITGVEARRFFIWVPITEMIVHPADNTIEFHSGFLSEARPIAEFKEVHPCKSSVGGCRGVDGILKEEVLAVAEV
ncbi:uncharacterized protein LOC109834771, partial [Asparagus officinalis]|uniref:uncharacterized protein LOC109834771 n=1 Tax=Asparagus officinalis TaxID=4686 RepID=UPI00098E846B